MSIGRQEIALGALAALLTILVVALALIGPGVVWYFTRSEHPVEETAMEAPASDAGAGNTLLVGDQVLVGDVEYHPWEEIHASGDLARAWSIAVDHGDVEKIERLLAEGVDPDTPLTNSSSRRTALHSAAWHGHGEIVRTLLAAGADPLARIVDRPGELGRTALHEAASRGHLEIVETLLAAGLPVNEEPRDEEQAAFVHEPLYAAVGDFRTFRLLLQHGADIERAGGLGRLLANAASQRDVETAAYLLSLGAPVEGAPSDLEYGYTPLWHAVTGWQEDGREAMVRLLLEHGANPATKLYAGGTILDLARENGQERVVRLMERALAGEPGQLPVEAVP